MIEFQKNLILQGYFIVYDYVMFEVWKFNDMVKWIYYVSTHDTNYYECKHCKIKVIKHPDDKITEVEE